MVSLASNLNIIGNLFSNAAIVLISLGVSPKVGVGSLVFLIVTHKLEYFANASIVGGEVHASVWELLFMEVLFGMVGMVATAVACA